jgi:AcrR family transcriptional regulator
MPKTIVTKEDWIILGYKRFSENGIAGIVIEQMAKKLEVNKSSFYWYFSTKKIFVQEIINFWENENTLDIINHVNSAKSPRSRFEKLIELSFRKDNNIDFIFYLKKYAKSNKELNNLIINIDNQRMQYTADLLQQLGISENESKVKSSIFYKYLIGYHEMIRYKKQEADYMKNVLTELSHLLKF